MQENLVLLSFGDSAKAYQALAEMKQAAAQDRLKLRSAAVVQRSPQGVLQVRDGYGDGAAANAPLVGTMLGGLLGVLGGPLGVLMLGATGAWLGSLASLDTVDRRLSLMEQITHAVPPGATALFADVEEGAVEVVDNLAKNLGAVVLRRPADAVLAEVQAAGEASDAAAKEARKVLRAKQKAELHEKWDKWIDDVGDRLTKMKDDLKAKF